MLPGARIAIRGGPLLVSLGFATLLLAAAARIPLAFEDSYHHWLIAAGFAQTGRLQDPLFGMEDTWLPGYHVLAGAILKLLGTGQIGALRAFSAACALLTLALLFRIAGGGGKGAVAVLLLALNPIFLLTGTSVVAEPLLTLALVGATAAALEDRRRPAAALAVAACLIGTKAWLWLLFAGLAFFLFTRLTRPWSSRALLWLLPALLAAAAVEALFSPAAHSLARASLELSSATVRGSAAGSPVLRVIDFAGYFALASLPAVLLAPLGLVREIHDPAARRRLALLHAPAIAYLAAVIVLVFAGAYTGSHRYLYPALPALSLLAATALARAQPALVAAGLAAAALVGVAFIPVLQGFGALDEGLARAGMAAGAVPGDLLTDSPTAAFWSGKPTAAIHGSRELPRDPDAAIAYLRARGVGSLVLEDIGYYRVNTVFPGLAQGRPVAPFAAVGTPTDYAVDGGKVIAVYRLTGDLRYLRTAPGSGKTAGLATGAVLELNGRALNGEGLGFGLPLVRYPDGDWFAGSSSVTDLGGPGTTAWRTVYALDRQGLENDTAFATVPSRGTVEVTYRVVGRDLTVAVRPFGLQPGYSELVLLNEEGAVFDDFADPSQTRLGAAIGSWTPVAGDWARFRSGRLGLEWSLPALAYAVGFHAAREVRTPDIDFSGLEYSFGPGFSGADYTVKVGDAR